MAYAQFDDENQPTADPFPDNPAPQPFQVQLPSVGRVVHLYTHGHMLGSPGPFPGFVAGINPDDPTGMTIDIVALWFGHANVLSVQNCPYKIPVASAPETYWEWPPRV